MAQRRARKAAIGLATALTFVAAAGWIGAARATSDDGAVRRGAALVEARCAACHATGRAGASPVAAAPAFRDLHRRYRVADLQEALGEGLVTTHAAMPEVVLEAGEVADVVAYLESLERPASPMRP